MAVSSAATAGLNDGGIGIGGHDKGTTVVFDLVHRWHIQHGACSYQHGVSHRIGNAPNALEWLR
jgi:hypothetical protein